jgi:hypothetical protein
MNSIVEKRVERLSNLSLATLSAYTGFIGLIALASVWGLIPASRVPGETRDFLSPLYLELVSASAFIVSFKRWRILEAERKKNRSELLKNVSGIHS